MHVRIALPGLAWPAPGMASLLAGLALPGLSALLGQASAQHGPPVSLEHWLARAFGIAAAPPFAALRMAANDLRPQAGAPLVNVDAVSLRFAREHLLLDGPGALRASADEIAALFSALNREFADIGHFFTHGTQGYLQLAEAHASRLDVLLAPLPDVIGRPVAHFQPDGPEAAWWARLANELQVFCHNHPLNTARESRGELPLNALWLWGAGSLPEGLSAPAPRLAGDHWLLRGLARASDSNLSPFDPRHPADWNLVTELHEPALHRDPDAWCKALQTLDATVLSPLATALRQRRIIRLEIAVPGDTAFVQLSVQAHPRWQFWRRPARPAQMARLLGEATAAEPAA